MGVKIDKIFDSFSANTIFKNKIALQTNYTPDDIMHRDEYIKQLASILAPSLRLEKPSNLFLYGKTGAGKTVSMNYIKNQLIERATKENISLSIISVNCKLRKVADTEYRILTELLRQLGENVPATGLPTDQLYKNFIKIIDNKKQILIMIFDEIDQAVSKIGDEFLYNFTRLNSELTKAQISLVGISNDLYFLDNVDPRVRSSLSEEEIMFPPYNASQIQDILTKRAEEAFKIKVEEGVIAKCSAYAARGHGDARRALDLLRIAGELAERDSKKILTYDYIDKANEKIERDKTIDFVSSCPEQYKIVLQSIISLSETKESFFTSDVYSLYNILCDQLKSDIRTQRRIGDIIREFELHGIIKFEVISRGRYGRTAEIKLSIYPHLIVKIKEIIKESLGL